MENKRNEPDAIERLKMAAQKAEEESRKKAETMNLGRPVYRIRKWNRDDSKRKDYK